MYSFLNPVATILYNIAIVLFITYSCYKRQGMFYRDRKYLFKKLIFNPPVMGISIFLLAEIILNVTENIANTYILTIPGVFVYFAGIVFIAFLFVIEKTNEGIEREHLERRKRLGIK